MKLNLCLTLLPFLILLTSCTTNSAQNKCDIKDLLLEKKDFPQGTIINDPFSPVDGYPAESADVSASFRNDGMFQVVARYSSANRAEREFTETSEYFKEDSFGDSWKTPVEISYESSFAQNYHVACGNLSQGYQCRMIGQYNKDFVFFFAYISDDGINLEGFQDLLIKLDDRIIQCREEK